MNQESKTMDAQTNAALDGAQSANTVARKPPHRFKKGNPGGPGRPPKVWTARELLDKQIRTDLRAAAKQHAPEAFHFLLEVLRDTDANTKDRITAATQILDRGFGKPTHHTEIKVDVYDKMSDVELIKLITGKELDANEVAAARAGVDDAPILEHEPRATNDDA